MSESLPTVGGGPGGESCGRCYYWEMFRPGELGECRKRAPVYDPNIVGADNMRYGHYPVEEADGWCGEFRPRAGEKP